MINFKSNNQARYVESMRKFLGIRKAGFIKRFNLTSENRPKCQGRLPKYPATSVSELEKLTNFKAAKADQVISLGERILLALAYANLGLSGLANDMNVSTGIVKKWCADQSIPADIKKLSKILNVQKNWMIRGEAVLLSADSHLGVLVGEDQALAQMQLFALTLNVIHQIPKSDDPTFRQAWLEKCVFSNLEMAKLARKSGGRWQINGEQLIFVPWRPLAQPQKRQIWSVEVEEIIQQEIKSSKTIYCAWTKIRDRCEGLNLDSAKFPKRITLYKRFQRQKWRAEGVFGLDINAQIATSAIKHASLIIN